MNKQSNEKKLRLALGLMQFLCVLVLLGGTYLAVIMGTLGILAVCSRALIVIAAGLSGLTAVAVSAVCTYLAVISFMRMCGRLKHERAFTAANAHSLRCISRCVLISAAIQAVAVLAISGLVIFIDNPSPGFYGFINYVLFLSPLLIISFVYAGVGLVCRALHGMLERARALQDENDLTV